MCLQVVLETDEASYTCVRPAAAYKKLHTHLSEQADICCEVRGREWPGGQCTAVSRVARKEAAELAGPAGLCVTRGRGRARPCPVRPSEGGTLVPVRSVLKPPSRQPLSHCLPVAAATLCPWVNLRALAAPFIPPSNTSCIPTDYP
jgi:hypothetical protein